MKIIKVILGLVAFGAFLVAGAEVETMAGELVRLLALGVVCGAGLLLNRLSVQSEAKTAHSRSAGRRR